MLTPHAPDEQMTITPMPEQPRISVGIPIYNGARWIGATAESILTQTERDLELILCDNASQDESETICRAIAAADPRVHYVRNPQNIGAPANYNLCLELANGEYFKWNSASDLCKPQLLEKCIAILDANPDVALAYSHTALLREDGTISSEDDTLELESESPVERFTRLLEKRGLNHVMNGVMRREMLNQTMLHQSFYSSDICLMAEISLYGKFVQLPECLFIRRHTPETASILRTEKDLQKYFDPQLKSKMLFQRIKLNGGFFQAVGRSSISGAQKWALYRYLLRRLRWSRKALFEDIVLAVKKTLSRE